MPISHIETYSILEPHDMSASQRFGLPVSTKPSHLDLASNSDILVQYGLCLNNALVYHPFKKPASYTNMEIYRRI